jgi:low affinity Fe/Cu permease
MYRQPFILGPTADKVLGFLAGMFGQLIGVVATIVVMFVWAGSDPLPDTQIRRDHATAVSIWSGMGCLLPAVLLAILAIFLFAQIRSPALPPDMTPFPIWSP